MNLSGFLCLNANLFYICFLAQKGIHEMRPSAAYLVLPHEDLYSTQNLHNKCKVVNLFSHHSLIYPSEQ